MDLKYVKETKDNKIISWPSVSNPFSFRRWRTMIRTVLGLPNFKLQELWRLEVFTPKMIITSSDPIVSRVGYMSNTLHDTIWTQKQLAIWHVTLYTLDYCFGT